MKKKKLNTLNDIHKLHQNLMGLLKQDPSNPLGNHKVSLEVRDNNDLLLIIESLLEVCVFALDGNGMLLSPNNQNVAKHDSVCRVLELVLNILPHSQMDFMDYVTEKLNGLDNTNTKSSE
ncbi:hypothetical protein H4O18_06945 [Arenibacter sp. BSSL-BM3]|uniref:Uncharacterized protein n=1 Tax=Arenibacter arenosicollis TaxID=2762274 RepID=A0ABR7QKQ2_9FLAO|nr:hypothetical protein [Arenibacter arenosicollis]MBC8767724.1 hypothetical protein [Arenibacter arenosicollis]